MKGNALPSHVELTGDGNVFGSNSSSTVVKPFFGELINSVAVVSTGHLQLTLLNGSCLSVRPEDWPDFSVLISDNTSSFVGRQFAFDALEQFIQGGDTRPGYFRIVADAGIGKTALAAEIARRHKAPAYFLSVAEGRTRWDRVIAGLCTQVIARYQLPYSYLPERAGQSVDFLRGLLREATAREAPVIVVIDGLDEANIAASRLGTDGLYLPQSLPDRVFFVLTQRPGASHLAPLPGVREEIFEIGRDDPLQLADIRELLRVQAEGPEIREALAQHRPAIPVDRFVAALENASQGNFMYLRYVLADIRAGQPGFLPLQLEMLPKGLNAYYEQFWQRMAPVLGAPKATRDEWREVGEPTIAILGAAQEPVSIGWISRLIGRPADDILDCALRPWEQFLSCNRGRFSEEKWRIVHRSFAEFLTQKIDLHRAHSRIADHYLELWGGLNQNLPKLQISELRTADMGYGLRHLVSHLLAAGRAADVHRALQAQWSLPEQHRSKKEHAIFRLGKSRSHSQLDQGKATNAWYWSHIEANDMAGYVEDYLGGWDSAEKATISEADLQEPITSIGVEMRYALIQSSLNSMAEGIPPVLLAGLVANHHWTIRDAVVYIGRMSESRRRAEAVVGIAPYAADYDRSDDFLGIVCGLDQDRHKVDALIALASHLSVRLLPEVITLLDRGEVKSEMGKACVLSCVAKRIPKEYLAAIIGALDKLFLTDSRKIVLSALALRYVDLQDPENAVRAAIALSKLSESHDTIALPSSGSNDARYEVAMGLAALGHFDDALTVACSVNDHMQRADLCTRLMLNALQAGQAPAAILAACAIPEDKNRAHALVALAQKVEGIEREEMQAEVFRRSQLMVHADDRLLVLINLLRSSSGHLKAEVLEAAMQAVELVPEVRHRVRFLGALANVVDQPTSDQLLTRGACLARSLKSAVGRLEAMTILLEYLPLSMARDILSEILDLAQGLTQDAVVSLADVHPGGVRFTSEEIWIREQIPSPSLSITQGFLSQLAHHLARMGFPDEAVRVGELAELSEFQMRSLIDRGAAATEGTDSEKARFLDSHRQKLADRGYVQLRLKQAASIHDKTARAKELAYLSSFLPKAERQRVLQDVFEHEEVADRVKLRLLLVDVVIDEDREALVRAALKETYELKKDLQTRTSLLEEIASRLPPAERERVLSIAVAEALGIEVDSDRSAFLDRLVPSLSQNSLKSLLDGLEVCIDRRLERYLEIAKRVIPELRSIVLRPALALLRDVPGGSVRYEYLNELAPWLPDDLLLDAVALTATIDDSDAVTETLLVLSVYMPEPFHRILLESLSALPYSRRMQVLVRLTEEFGAAGLGARALNALRSIPDADVRHKAAQQLAQSLARDGLPREALAALQEITDPSARLIALSTVTRIYPVGTGAEYRSFVRKALGAIGDQYERLRAYAQFKELVTEEMLAHDVGTLVRSPTTDRPSADKPQSGKPDIIVRLDNPDMLVVLAPALSRSQLDYVLGKVQKPVWRTTPDSLLTVLAALAPRAAQLGRVNEALDLIKQLESLAREAEVQYRLRQMEGIVQAFWTIDERRRASVSLRAVAIAGVVPFLPEPYRTEQLEQLLKLDWRDRPKTLARLAKGFADTGRHAEALSMVTYLSEGALQSESLRELAAEIPSPYLSRALSIARNISDKTLQDRAIARYVARLSDAGLDEDAMRELRSLTDDTAIGEALSGLAENAPNEYLGSLLELVLSLKSQEALVKAFVVLAVRLPESRVRQELPSLIRGLTESLQVELVSKLATHLDSRLELLQDLIDIALGLKMVRNRSTALAWLTAPWLSSADQSRAVAVRAWQRSTRQLSNRSRRDALSDILALARISAAIGGPRAIGKIADAVQDVGRWWP